MHALTGMLMDCNPQIKAHSSMGAGSSTLHGMLCVPRHRRAWQEPHEVVSTAVVEKSTHPKQPDT